MVGIRGRLTADARADPFVAPYPLDRRELPDAIWVPYIGMSMNTKMHTTGSSTSKSSWWFTVGSRRHDNRDRTIRGCSGASRATRWSLTAVQERLTLAGADVKFTGGTGGTAGPPDRAID